MSLNLIAKHSLTPRVTLSLYKGSVLDFESPTGAIVNAANERCLFGGGVDGAITAAGGKTLAKARLNLPVLNPDSDDEEEDEIRCRTGSAVVTGPGNFGKIGTPYVIHAVGPSYYNYPKTSEGHQLLRSAYRQSLDVALEHNLTEIAFPLLSAGIFRARVPLDELLMESMSSIQEWASTQSATAGSLEHIGVFAFTHNECQTLADVCDQLFTSKSDEKDNEKEDKTDDYKEDEKGGDKDAAADPSSTTSAKTETKIDEL